MAEKGLKLVGKDKDTNEAQPISVIRDDNGHYVLRIVDSAPFAFDSSTDTFKIQLQEIGENAKSEMYRGFETIKKEDNSNGLFSITDGYEDLVGESEPNKYNKIRIFMRYEEKIEKYYRVDYYVNGVSVGNITTETDNKDLDYLEFEDITDEFRVRVFYDDSSGDPLQLNAIGVYGVIG